MCAEYIPSKLYEYLWMQRPILALVHHNAQMLDLVRASGHTAIATNGLTIQQVASKLGDALSAVLEQWKTGGGLMESVASSPYTTAQAVHNVLHWTQEIVTTRGKQRCNPY
jgi:hypothetical protein